MKSNTWQAETTKTCVKWSLRNIQYAKGGNLPGIVFMNDYRNVIDFNADGSSFAVQ